MIPFLEKTILQLQDDLEKGLYTSKDLVMAYMKRISDYDKQGGCVNSVAEINPDAIYIAEAMDRERTIHGKRTVMHGIPVLVKDNINTGDKMKTTAGSITLQNNYAKEDSPLIANLRKSGAIILGKTNMSEFARYMATETINGYSSLGGQVLNPYKLDADVSGSSSGSGVAASCDFASVTVGTETEGSIICPAILNGVVGMKPTVGVVSRAGIIPIANQDTAGPMGKSVTDVAVALTYMSGGDGIKDAATICTDHLIGDYMEALDETAIQGMRIGINRAEYKTLEKDEQEIYEQAIIDIQKAGAIIVESTDIENIYGEIEDEKRAALLYEFKSHLNAYLAHYGNADKIASLKDIIEYNNNHFKEGLRYGQDILLEAQFTTTGRLTEPEYIEEKIRILNKSQKEGIDTILLENSLDVLLCPGYSDLPAIAGYPVINVPAGIKKNKIPYGISFVGGAFTEKKLIQAAYGYEQVSKRRVAPTLV